MGKVKGKLSERIGRKATWLVMIARGAAKFPVGFCALSSEILRIRCKMALSKMGTLPLVESLPQIKKQIEYQIPPLAHTPMYNWHKFWGRKTWNVVAEFIDTYCSKGGIVLDPFSGSGITALEALKSGRKAIAIDLMPIANEILRATVLPVDIELLVKAFDNIKIKVMSKINELYSTICDICEKEVIATCFIWKRKNNRKLLLVEKRFFCPHCGREARRNVRPNQKDIREIKRVESLLHECGYWYPDNKLYYNGKPFKEKQQYETLDELFTIRNLYALAMLMDNIESEPNETSRYFLKLAFTSMSHLCSTMMPVRESRDLSGCWTQHSYWYALTFMEQNVWNKFESAFNGTQGLIRAKIESSKYYKGIRFARTYNDLIKDKADILLHTGDSLSFLSNMAHNKHTVDYCFTDPPYNGSIQYGELCYLWNAWLKNDNNYVKTVLQDEVIENSYQNKPFDVYHSMIRAVFDKLFSVLKPNAYLTVTFTNPHTRYRNATIKAAVNAGFRFEKVHHQEPVRASAKSLLQPFGSIKGDFYLRFHKDVNISENNLTNLTRTRFENVVVNTAIQVLAERGEPTPYTIIVNAIDPVLYKEGYFKETPEGLDIKTVLKQNVGKTFRLVDTTIGKTHGKLWWLQDESIISNIDIPLNDRVEETVIRLLHRKFRVTFTDVWKEVCLTFPNSLTPDTSSIKKVLEEYAEKDKKGEWQLKGIFKSRESQHSKIIAELALLGEALGYEIYIGKREQGDVFDSKIKGHNKLGDFCTKRHPNWNNVVRASRNKAKDIDVVWYKNEHIDYIFEVETTTSITSALERGSSVWTAGVYSESISLYREGWSADPIVVDLRSYSTSICFSNSSGV